MEYLMVVDLNIRDGSKWMCERRLSCAGPGVRGVSACILEDNRQICNTCIQMYMHATTGGAYITLENIVIRYYTGSKLSR